MLIFKTENLRMSSISMSFRKREVNRNTVEIEQKIRECGSVESRGFNISLTQLFI